GPLLRRQALRAAEVGRTVVVLPPREHAYHAARRVAVDCPPIFCTENSTPEAGLGASIKAGLVALGNVEHILIMLPDLIDLSANHLRTVAAVGHARGTDEDGIPGHPVSLPLTGETRAALAELGDDDDAPKRMLRGLPIKLVNIGPAATRDLDTPEDWAVWRASL
ncbi:MAG: nucleotidyltransferase family protein, partial [Shimia sp.]